MKTQLPNPQQIRVNLWLILLAQKPKACRK